MRVIVDGSTEMIFRRTWRRDLEVEGKEYGEVDCDLDEIEYGIAFTAYEEHGFAELYGGCFAAFYIGVGRGSREFPVPYSIEVGDVVQG